MITSTQVINFWKGEISHVIVYNSLKKLVKLGFVGEEKIGYQLIMNDCIFAFKRLAEKKDRDFEFIPHVIGSKTWTSYMIVKMKFSLSR
ncbi:hypothetical protein GOQ29_03710 [Clostridium sp. D2Q-14]|uniref:hypothetical protein n=1 Tax=Anaeromonas gelatinilytica TaxID=2683194 RepID=UPI00193BF42F|nr:hypothetical protein [Anaeromonas gelatinilytica]MBS4534718.1 hypothetical protein [Anaeromonas gelatinilytica]